jgi:hypothetical protein
VPRQNAAESRKIPESGSVIPREGVERGLFGPSRTLTAPFVIPREGVERNVTDIVIHACAVTRTI